MFRDTICHKTKGLNTSICHFSAQNGTLAAICQFKKQKQKRMKHPHSRCLIPYILIPTITSFSKVFPSFMNSKNTVTFFKAHTGKSWLNNQILRALIERPNQNTVKGLFPPNRCHFGSDTCHAQRGNHPSHPRPLI